MAELELATSGVDLDIPEVTVGVIDEAPNKCTIVLLNDCKDLEKLTNWEQSNWILIWSEPRDIGGIIELNYHVRQMRKKYREYGVEIDRVILDLQMAGFPPMNHQQYTQEAQMVADRYVQFAKTAYQEVESFYFI